MSFHGSGPRNTSTLIATNRQVACTVGGEVVILHLDDGIYYSLNSVGARVWALLHEPRTTDELVARVVEEFDVSAERCRADVEQLLSALWARGLVIPAAHTGRL